MVSALGGGPLGSTPLGGDESNKPTGNSAEQTLPRVRTEAHTIPPEQKGGHADLVLPSIGGRGSQLDAGPGSYSVEGNDGALAARRRLQAEAALRATMDLAETPLPLRAATAAEGSGNSPQPPSPPESPAAAPPPVFELKPSRLANENEFFESVVEQAAAYATADATVISGVGRTRRLRIGTHHEELFLLAYSLGQTARAEIVRLSGERPNDLSAIERNAKQRELLEIFAAGFEQLAEALAAFAENRNQPALVSNANAVVQSVAKKVNEWWAENGKDAVGWCVRLPVIAGGIGLLGLAGADMAIATTAVSALVGGKPVVDALKSSKDEDRPPA